MTVSVFVLFVFLFVFPFFFRPNCEPAPACGGGGGGGGEQGRKGPDTVFKLLKYHPSLSLTNVSQTTELPWIQLGFSSSGVSVTVTERKKKKKRPGDITESHGTDEANSKHCRVYDILPVGKQCSECGHEGVAVWRGVAYLTHHFQTAPGSSFLHSNA